METDQILDLFDISSTDNAPAALPPPPSTNNVDNITGGKDAKDAAAVDMVDVTTGQVREKGKKGYLDDLGELWDERAYEEEFDLGGFLRTMKM